jgi:hypothetical protein
MFRLSVIWIGKTVEEAKKGSRYFQISIESNNSAIVSKNPTYSCASMCEKILDISGRNEHEAEIRFKNKM